jgi:hypothetical protein
VLLELVVCVESVSVVVVVVGEVVVVVGEVVIVVLVVVWPVVPVPVVSLALAELWRFMGASLVQEARKVANKIAHKISVRFFIVHFHFPLSR